MIGRRTFLRGLTGALLGRARAAEAQPPAKVYRVGVVLEGGPYYAAVDGVRAGLREQGFEEGKQYTLEVRDVKGDLAAVAVAARSLERGHVDVIYALATSVSVRVQQATTAVPVVFYVGRDPIAAGLVKTLARPGGRLTGVESRSADLMAKRLEIVREMIPGLRRVIGFYDPGNANAREYATLARDAARQLRIELVERHVRSVDDLRASLRTLKTGEADALLIAGDGMITSQTELVVEAAKARKLPTMFNERTGAVAGGLASYGTSYYALGRLAAKYVHRMLTGTSPADLPVERSDRYELVVNLKTAKAIGVTIPQSVLGRADEIIQ